MSWDNFIRQGFSQLPLVIQIAIVISLLAIVTTAMVFISILIMRGVRAYKGRRNSRFIQQADSLVLEQVIMNEGLQDDKGFEFLPSKAFHVLPLEKKWVRRLLVERIMEYRKNFSGSVSNKLRQLYIALRLQKDAQRNINSMWWNKKVAAISELFSMEVGGMEDEISPLLHHRNRYVRGISRCYFVKMSEGQPFEFLSDIRNPLVTWEQFELFNIIVQRKDMKLPLFSRWMNADCHPSVISFCFKLAVYFQQYETIPAIMRYIDSDNEALQVDAINSLGKLVAEEAEPAMVAIYPAASLAVKVEILKALGRIGSGKYLAFLEDVFETSDEFLLRKHSAKSIVNHEALSKKELLELESHSDAGSLVFLHHAMNPLIKY